MSRIDNATLTRLRLAAALSQRALARKAGVSAAVIARLEAGDRGNELSLAHLGRIADALGAPAATLLTDFEQTSEDAPVEDVVVVEAALAGAKTFITSEELARGLGWKLERTASAIRQLHKRLATTGLFLRRSSNGYALIRREGVLTNAQRQGLEQARVHRRSLRRNELALLRAIVDGEITTGWEARARNPDRVTLATLLNGGYVSRRNRRYVPSKIVHAALARRPAPRLEQSRQHLQRVTLERTRPSRATAGGR